MARKSKVSRMSVEAKERLTQLLREDRLTLDEILEDLRQRFPEEAMPSRTGLGRYRKTFEEILSSHRNITIASEALVSELGDSFDDKAGALLSQAVTTLAINAVDNALDEGNVVIKDVLDMARAAKSVQETRSLSLKERQAIAKEAREKLLREQAETLDQEVKAGGLDEDQAMFWRKKFLGV
ncbi:TPA: phage protein Gp27 family protein [Citrobacter farmeri]